MPYIKKERREDLATVGLCPENAGELNYAITMLLIRYWRQPGEANYQRINDIVGACGGALHEFQRRVVGKYEDMKIVENGDCY
jgi:hypothetical protein